MEGENLNNVNENGQGPTENLNGNANEIRIDASTVQRVRILTSVRRMLSPIRSPRQEREREIEMEMEIESERRQRERSGLLSSESSPLSSASEHIEQAEAVTLSVEKNIAIAAGDAGPSNASNSEEVEENKLNLIEDDDSVSSVEKLNLKRNRDKSPDGDSTFKVNKLL